MTGVESPSSHKFACCYAQQYGRSPSETGQNRGSAANWHSVPQAVISACAPIVIRLEMLRGPKEGRYERGMSTFEHPDLGGPIASLFQESDFRRPTRRADDKGAVYGASRKRAFCRCQQGLRARPAV